MIVLRPTGVNSGHPGTKRRASFGIGELGMTGPTPSTEPNGRADGIVTFCYNLDQNQLITSKLDPLCGGKDTGGFCDV